MKFLKVKDIYKEEFYINLEQIQYFSILNRWRGVDFNPGLVKIFETVLEEESSVKFLDVVKYSD